MAFNQEKDPEKNHLRKHEVCTKTGTLAAVDFRTTHLSPIFDLLGMFLVLRLSNTSVESKIKSKWRLPVLHML